MELTREFAQRMAVIAEQLFPARRSSVAFEFDSVGALVHELALVPDAGPDAFLTSVVFEQIVCADSDGD
jgi:hypothetical protein